MRKKSDKEFIPAVRFHLLTPLYDFILSLADLGKKYRKKVLEVFNIPNKKIKVLDAGCGSGSLALDLKRQNSFLELCGIDIDNRMLSQAKEKAEKEKIEIRFKKEPIQALSFRDSSFDIVYSSLVLHHLPTETKKRAIAEIHRVLKKGGYFLLSDVGKPKKNIPHLFSLFASIFEEGYDNYKGKIPSMLLEQGFKVEKIGGYKSYVEIYKAVKI